MKPLPIEAQRIVRLAAELREQLEGLREVKSDADAAIEQFSENAPARFDLRGVGSVLHDFYSGIESLFERVARMLNGGLPEGEDWHMQLLRDMALDLERVRPPVISEEVRDCLDEYRRFRHLVRHTYGHRLKWERMAPLLFALPEVFSRLTNEIDRFLMFLHDLARQLGNG